MHSALHLHLAVVNSIFLKVWKKLHNCSRAAKGLGKRDGTRIEYVSKNRFMKTSKNTTNKQNKQGNSRKPRPEIRDDTDSRQRKEKGYKGESSKKPLRKKLKK